MRAAAAGRRGDVLLVAEALSKTHDGERQLFRNLTFTISAGDKLAIVGPNGAGKSTLLKIIAGQDDHNGGVVTRNKGARVGYLPQADLLLPLARGSGGNGGGGASGSSSKSRKKGGKGGSGGAGGAGAGGAGDGGMTVLQAVLSSDSAAARAVQEYERALAASSAAADSSADSNGSGGDGGAALQAAIERMDALNAWELDTEARRLLEAVGLPDPGAPIAGLSGGQLRRLALAGALLGGPDLLVLDEPSNHVSEEVHTACPLLQSARRLLLLAPCAAPRPRPELPAPLSSCPSSPLTCCLPLPRVLCLSPTTHNPPSTHTHTPLYIYAYTQT